MRIKNENGTGQIYRDPDTKETYKFEPGETKRVKKEIGNKILELRGFTEIKKDTDGGEE